MSTTINARKKDPTGYRHPKLTASRAIPSLFWQLKSTLTALLALPSVRRNSLPLAAARAEDLLLQLMAVKTATAKAKAKAVSFPTRRVSRVV